MMAGGEAHPRVTPTVAAAVVVAGAEVVVEMETEVEGEWVAAEVMEAKAAEVMEAMVG